MTGGWSIRACDPTRGATGRDKIVKFEGQYHGVHDYALISVGPNDMSELGDEENPVALRWGRGIPDAVADTIVPARYNNIDFLRRLFERQGEQIAAIEELLLRVPSPIIFDHLGRLEGLIARVFQNGFAMTISATARKRDKLAAQLTWLANRDILNLPEDRRHDRIIPRNPIAMLTLEDGTKMTCRIIDMSLSGAAIAAENRPPMKSLVMLGKVQARVVRKLEEGFALEFVHSQIAETLEDNVTAR